MNQASESLLFKNATALLGDGKYLTHAVVTTDCGKISYIGDKIPENNGKYRVIDCRSGLLMPGFYNIHCHSPMTLFRGIGEDLPLQRWLNEKIYPAEDRLTPNQSIPEQTRGGGDDPRRRRFVL